ncbi:MAG: T9SS type A sorting domain-containing protein [Bacteroidota bacterium]
MKKIYALTSALALIGTGVFAQQALKSNLSSISTAAATAEGVVYEDVSSPMAPGDTIISYDFSNAADYSITSAANSSSDAEWRVGTVNPTYAGYQGTIQSPTAANGYAVCSGLGGLLAPTGPFGSQAIDTRIQIVSSIPTTGKACALRFVQCYRHFNTDECFVEFSTDGTNWFSKKINPASEYPTNQSPIRVNARVEVLFPPQFNNQPQVFVRFRWTGTAAVQGANVTGAGYGWQVDDVAIVELPGNNLRILQTYAGGLADDQTFLYQAVPLAQAPKLFPGVQVTNSGNAAQVVTATVRVSRNGTFLQSFTASSDSTLKTGDTATIAIETFKPTSNGLYNFDFSINGTSTDPEYTPNDNLGKDSVLVGNFWADDQAGLEFKGDLFTPYRNGGVASQPFASVYLGQAVQVFDANGTQATGITTVLPNTATSKVTVGQSLYFYLYKYPNQEYVNGFSLNDLSLEAQAEYEVTAADTFTYSAANPAGVIEITVPFDQAATMTPGIYIATLNYLGGTDIYNYAFHKSANRDGSAVLAGNISAGFDETTFRIFNNVNPFIKLNAFATSGIKEGANASFTLGQNQPNPFNGTSSFDYSLTTAANVSVTITDITGKVVSAANLGTVAAGAHKHTISRNDLTTGIYFYSLEVNGEKVTKKMVISE